MIAYADDLLGRQGCLLAATHGLFARRLAVEPDLGTRMTRLRRGPDLVAATGSSHATMQSTVHEH